VKKAGHGKVEEKDFRNEGTKKAHKLQENTRKYNRRESWLGKCEGKWENVGLLLLNPDQAPASREEERGP
jgi:hypothetical protein